MKHRNPFAVFILPFVTLGIYSIVWHVKTKNEMNAKGAQIPTAWLLIIPFVSIYWLWKYAEGVEHVTNGKQSQALAFVLLFLLGSIGSAIIQNDFNNLDVVATSSDMPVASGFNPYAAPTDSFTQPTSSSLNDTSTSTSTESVTPQVAFQPINSEQPLAPSVATTPPVTSTPDTTNPYQSPETPSSQPVEDSNQPQTPPSQPPTSSQV
jgi:uncharacterized protein DUF4234